MSRDNVVTTIAARGFVVAEFDTAHFSLQFTEKAKKAKLAKSGLKKGVDKIAAVLDSLKSKGLIMSEGSFKTSVSVQPNYVYNRTSGQNDLIGQRATYSVSFQTQVLEMVNEVYDELSELDLNELVVNQPGYSVRAQETLKLAALEDAWVVAQKLFNDQCRVLGKNPAEYSVSNWEVDYSGIEYGKGRNFASNRLEAMPLSDHVGGGDSSPIDLNSGNAVVAVTLIVKYVKSTDSVNV